MPARILAIAVLSLGGVAGCASLPTVQTYPPLAGDSGLEWVAITVKGLE